jgi:hypothetical protein
MRKLKASPKFLLTALAFAVIAVLASFGMARAGAFGSYGVTVERFSACLLVTLMALFFSDLWRRKIPLSYYGNVLDPSERPLAYALSMGFLSLFFVFMAVFGWVREISRVVSGE